MNIDTSTITATTATTAINVTNMTISTANIATNATSATKATNATTDSKFESISSVSERFKKPAAQVNLFLGKFVDFNTGVFSWSGLKDELQRKKDPDFTLVDLQSNSIVSSKKEYKVFAQSVTKLLTEELNVVLTEADVKGFETKISTTFRDVKLAINANILKTYYDEEGHNEGYTYRLLYHFPDADNEHTFLTLVLSFFFKADIKKSGGWFYNSTSENYTVKVISAKFLVFDTFSF
ncbi:hypothetical protein EC973_001425 [Apophysomyces ossiformis]|uniref:Uncharacterized protein n=1 Tax=Apophysomyces ossiformis TaxID=679940 RepID=A0A8H7EME9_9FUNG|nr:hypothetical protein EC973_001425 [Apophysomyces ossiformis]